MTGKQLLNSCRMAMLEIDSLQEQADSLEEIVTRTTQTLSDVRVQSSHTNSREDALVQLYDKCADIRSRIAVLTALTAQVDILIGQMEDGRKRAILRYRYLSRFSWNQIAKRLHYSQSWVSRLHDEAVEDFTVLYNKKRPTD